MESVLIQPDLIDIEFERSGRAVGAQLQHAGIPVSRGVEVSQPRSRQPNALPFGVGHKGERGCGQCGIGWRELDLKKATVAAYFKLHAA